MSSTEPALQDLITGALSVFKENSNMQEQPNAKGFLAAVLTATAGLAKLSIKYGKGLFNNSFVHLADNASLLILAKEYGIFRRQALPARITIKVTATGVQNIPAGTIFDHKSGQFISQEVTAFDENVAMVSAVATSLGKNDFLTLNDTLEIQQLISADQAAVINLIDFSGQNEETYEELRARLLAIIRNLGPAGSQPYYIRQTLLQENVIEAFVYRGPEVAQVNIFPIMVGRKLPEPNEITRIQNAINDPEISFVGDYITVNKMEEIKVKVQILNLAPVESNTRERITAGIKDYVESRRPRQHSLEQENNNYIAKLDIIAIVSAVGATQADVTLKINENEEDTYVLKSPAIDGYNVQPQLPVLEEVSYDPGRS